MLEYILHLYFLVILFDAAAQTRVGNAHTHQERDFRIEEFCIWERQKGLDQGVESAFWDWTPYVAPGSYIEHFDLFDDDQFRFGGRATTRGRQ